MTRALDRRRSRSRHRRAATAASWSAQRRLDRQPHRCTRGDLFVALDGPKLRRPRFRRRRARQGRRRGRWSAARRRSSRQPTRRCSSSPTRRRRSRLWAAPRARRGAGHRHRRHRQRRQDRHQGGAAPRARAPRADHRIRRQPQQPVGRAAVARAHAARGRIRRVRDGHEPCRRDRRADAGWCGPTSRVITTVEPAHLGFFAFGRGDRRRQGRDLQRHGRTRMPPS